MLEKTQEVLNFIANDDLFKNNDIRFVGGTALSYLIKHRLSEDLAFASLEFPKEEILKTMLKYGAVKLEHNPTEEDYVKNDGGDINSHYMKFMLKGVKIEFFTPILNILEERVWREDRYTSYEDTELKISSLDTIIYMKTTAFWNRKNTEICLMFIIYWKISILAQINLLNNTWNIILRTTQNIFTERYGILCIFTKKQMTRE